MEPVITDVDAQGNVTIATTTTTTLDQMTAERDEIQASVNSLQSQLELSRSDKAQYESQLEAQIDSLKAKLDAKDAAIAAAQQMRDEASGNDGP